MGKYTEQLPDGTVIYRASSLGACSQALYYDRSGVEGEPTPDWLQKAYDEGKGGEQPILDALYQRMQWKMLDEASLEKQGYELGEGEYSGQVRIWAQVGSTDIWVRGHLDGIAQMWAASLGQETRLGEYRGVEVKLFARSTWDKYQRHGIMGFPMYAMQLSAYMKGLGLPFLFVVGLKDENGELARGDDFKAVIDIREIDEPPVPWVKIMGKVLSIEKRLETGDAPTCEKPLMYPCPFYPYHDETEVNELAVGERLLFDSLASEYERHRKLEKDHGDKRKEVGAAIAQYLDDTGKGTPPVTADEKVDSVSTVGKDFQVTDVRYWRKGFVDEERLKAAGIDPEAFREDGGEVRYPKITRVSATDDG